MWEAERLGYFRRELHGQTEIAHGAGAGDAVRERKSLVSAFPASMRS